MIKEKLLLLLILSFSYLHIDCIDLSKNYQNGSISSITTNQPYDRLSKFEYTTTDREKIKNNNLDQINLDDEGDEDDEEDDEENEDDDDEDDYSISNQFSYFNKNQTQSNITNLDPFEYINLSKNNNHTNNTTGRNKINETLNDSSQNDIVLDHLSLLRLRRSLLYFYDRNSRPISKSSNSLYVYIGISIVQINNLDEIYQVMTSTLQVSIRWNDEFLRWNESIYSNTIAFTTNEIWTPDIITENNMNNFKYDFKDAFFMPYVNNIFDFNERNKYMILVKPNGDCRWVFPIKLMSACQLNQEYFPFDIQQCYLDFLPSAHLSKEVYLKKFEKGVHLKLINEGEFDLIEAQANEYLKMDLENKLDSNSNITGFRVKLILKRKITFYANKIIIPYFVFYVVTLFTYLVPAIAGEKKSYSTSILISGMIYLKDISYYIPKTIILPLLSIYFNLNFIFVFICLIFSTFIYAIYYLDKTKRPVPTCLAKLLKKKDCYNEKQLFKHVKNNSSSLYLTSESHKKECSDYYPKTSIKEQLNYVKYQLNSLDINYNKETVTNRKILLIDKSNQSMTNLANDTLNLLKNLKSFINKHDNSENSIDDGCAYNNYIENGNKYSNETINYDEKTLLNFHYINTLETFKLTMIQTKNESYQINESRSRSPSIINYDNINNSNKKAKYYLFLMKQYKSQIRKFLEKNELSGESNKIKTVKPRLIKSGDDWKLIAIMLDKFFFYLFAFTVPVSIFAMTIKIMFYNI